MERATTPLPAIVVILNREIYDKGMRELTQGSMADAGDFLASYQSIEIMLDGSVHVIH